jgi:hypothetical protein
MERGLALAEKTFDGTLRMLWGLMKTRMKK